MTMSGLSFSTSPGGQLGWGNRSRRSRINERREGYRMSGALQREGQPSTAPSRCRRAGLDGLLVLCPTRSGDSSGGISVGGGA